MKKVLTTGTISAIFVIIAVMLFTINGCKSGQQKQEEEAPTEATPIQEDIIQDLSGYPIPTSYQITELIYEAGARYILAISNDPSSVDKYITQRNKALNLGVYGADLCYATTYMMKQSTMHYLEASKTLIDDIGVTTAFNNSYADRVENNLDNRDSLIQIVSMSFEDSWEYLVENQQDVLARLVVCGSWIEGVYITTNIALTADDNTKFLEILANQKESLDELVELMEPVKESIDVTEIFKGLFDLQDIYADVGDALTEEELEKVSARIETLRTAIVE